jgi:hypothetical protein
MLEMGMSGLMSGEGKQPAASRSRSSALPRLYASDGRVAGVAGTTNRDRAPLLKMQDLRTC